LRQRSCSRPLRPNRALALLAVSLAATPLFAAGSLQPTHAGLLRQSLAARAHGFSYLLDDDQVDSFVSRGLLVPVHTTADIDVHPDIQHAVARPEVARFIGRLAEQYRDACGERLVVTSLLRTKNRQPQNSHPLSVHPTGMALDLRVSNVRKCRSWLESTLVELEGRGVLEAARERRPPHYHVVVFPTQYAAYLGNDGPAATVAVETVEAIDPRPVPAEPLLSKYQVRSGDTLWRIAQSHGTTVASLRQLNGLRTTRLRPGQTLTIPSR
jgi:LysM repeat protein